MTLTQAERRAIGRGWIQDCVTKRFVYYVTGELRAPTDRNVHGEILPYCLARRLTTSEDIAKAAAEDRLDIFLASLEAEAADELETYAQAQGGLTGPAHTP